MRCLPACFLVTLINVCHSYSTLRITDYYWQVESLYEWMTDVYSNDCSFFNIFIGNYLMPMNMKIVNSSANISIIEDYFVCDDSKPDSVGRAHDRCEIWNLDCSAHQHFMFEVSKHSWYHNNVNNDSIVDSLLNRTFVHFTMLYQNYTILNETSDVASILNEPGIISDYKSYLTSIANYSYQNSIYSLYSNNSIRNMSWKLVATRISMYLGYDIYDVNITLLSQECNNLIDFNWFYSSDGENDCYGLFTLEDVTKSSYLKSMEFMKSDETVTCGYFFLHQMMYSAISLEFP